MHTIQEMLLEARGKLTGPEGRQESEILMEDVCGISRSQQFSRPEDKMTDEQREALQPRILTDISGTFDTVIIETVHENLASYEQYRTMMLSKSTAAGVPS